MVTNYDVLNFLKNGLTEEELVELWNEYSTDTIYSFSDPEEFFNEYFSSPYEAFRASYFGNVNYSDKFVAFNAYKNLETFNNFDDYGDYETLAHWLKLDEDWQKRFTEEQILEYKNS